MPSRRYEALASHVRFGSKADVLCYGKEWHEVANVQQPGRRETWKGPRARRLLSRGAYKGEIAAKYTIKPKPPRQLFCKLPVALNRYRTAHHVAPTRLAEVDRDEITNITSAYEIDGETWVFHAYVHVRVF